MGRSDAPESSLSPSDVPPPPRLLNESQRDMSTPPLQSERGRAGAPPAQSELLTQGTPDRLKLPAFTVIGLDVPKAHDVVVPPPPPPEQKRLGATEADLILEPPFSSRDKVESQRQELPRNVSLDDKGRIAKISYPEENKTREFGRDANGEINRLTTTTPNGQFSYEKEGGKWVYLSPDNSRILAPDMMLDANGDFSKVTRDGVALTQRLDGTSYEEEHLAIGARIQRDADGNPELIKRGDGSQIQANYRDGRLDQVIERDGADSVTWKHDKNSDWTSNEVPPKTVHDMKVESNGNLTYSVDKTRYTVRANGSEVEEGKGKARFDFDEQGRISSRTSSDGKSTLTFGYHGSSNEPATIQVVDRQKNETRRYIHQPEEGGWTQVDDHNRSQGTWKGDVKISDDGTYSIKPTGDTWTSYLTDGTKQHEEKKEPALEAIARSNPALPAEGSASPNEAPDSPGTRSASPNEAPDLQLKGPSSMTSRSALPIEGPTSRTERPASPNEVPASPSEHAALPTDNSGAHNDATVIPKESSDATKPARPNVANINEITDHSFQLKGYMLPSPDQLGAGSCLYMSATGIAEFLLNKSKGIVNPQVGGATDLSEAWTLNLSKTVQLGNNYTDAPELLAKAGALPDSRMKFKAYAGSSWMSEPAIGGRGTEKLPPFKKDVLYSAGGEGSQNTHGRMREQDLDHIKKYLRETQSPVLFVYKPPTANYWHANIITGYNDKTQSFTVRDSSFGQPQTNKPSYNYDGRSPWGPRPYRHETQMPYYQVMAWGNHATGYRLANPTGG